ncbi:MAG TPA: orotate phosphoribosyltransferase [Chloroflexota bacterium]|nr:orotate phosphoribosyltransferase [Chloroflexota bacterium]
MEERRLQLLNEIKQHAINFGTFVLSSGQTSHYYLDCRRVTLSPFGLWLTANAFLDAFEGTEIDAVGGMSVAADPITAGIVLESWHRGRPLRGCVVRKEAKGHGMQRQVEGPLQKGDRVVVVDDVLTTGGSIFQAIDAVEAAGANVASVAVILDRLQGGGEKIRERGYPLLSLFTLEDIRDYLEAGRPRA